MKPKADESDTSSDTASDAEQEQGAEQEQASSEAAGLKQAASAERKRAQLAEARVAKLEADKAAADAAAAVERGESDRLWQEAQPRLAKLKEMEAAQATELEALEASNVERIKRLPKDLRVLIPDGLSVKNTAKHLGHLEARAAKRADEQPQTDRTRGKPTKGGVKIPPSLRAEVKREAAKLKLEPEEYFERFYQNTKAGQDILARLANK